jgi:hypothetical protein
LKTAIIIFLLAVALMAGGLLAFLRNARQDLPKNLPPPLKDEPEDDWGAGKSGNDSDPKP